MVRGKLVVRGGPQVNCKKSLEELYETLNETRIHPDMFVLKLPLWVDLQQNVHNFLSVIILENTSN
jgi:hypothetical protein